jgi:hypothetical protein
LFPGHVLDVRRTRWAVLRQQRLSERLGLSERRLRAHLRRAGARVLQRYDVRLGAGLLGWHLPALRARWTNVLPREHVQQRPSVHRWLVPRMRRQRTSLLHEWRCLRHQSRLPERNVSPALWNRVRQLLPRFRLAAMPVRRFRICVRSDVQSVRAVRQYGRPMLHDRLGLHLPARLQRQPVRSRRHVPAMREQRRSVL